MSIPIFSNNIPISNNPCPKCGGRRNNDTDDKRFGYCMDCGARWFVIKGGLVS